MNKKIVAFVFFLVCIIIIFIIFKGNNQNNRNQFNDKIQVSTSFYPLYFFAQNIGADKANVINITPAGAESHNYEPTAQDIITIENSKLLILNGEGLEIWANNIQQNINDKKTLIMRAGERLATQKLLENGNNIIDPHVWLSPTLAQQMVDKIVDGFIKIDPSNSFYYEQNADTLKSKLKDLDSQYKQGLGNCSKHNIITSHAAFGYLATNYNFNQVPIAGLFTDTEPSPKQLINITNFAKKNNVKYIFFENLVSPKLSQTLAQEINATILPLNPIEGLTKDELNQGKNYISEMQNNLVNLQIALQCKK